MSASRAQQRLWRGIYGETLNAFLCRREIPVERLSGLVRTVLAVGDYSAQAGKAMKNTVIAPRAA